MKISMAMATYNGEKYIEKQLESLNNQTRKIDEVIICDDCSKDNTVSIINTYIQKNHLNKWKCIVNTENLGFSENFRKAISMTTGDVVFLCDQDDEWHKNKIEAMTQIMDTNPQIKLLASSIQIIDQDGNFVKVHSCPEWIKRLNKIESGTLVNIDFLDICNRNYAPGCTMAITRDIIEAYLKRKKINHLPHDWFLALLAGCENGAYLINKSYVNYRVHGNNAIGTQKDFRVDNKTEQVRRLTQYRERLFLAKQSNYRNEKQLNCDITYINNRIELYKNKSFFNWVKVVKSSRDVSIMGAKISRVNLKDLLFCLNLIIKK